MKKYILITLSLFAIFTIPNLVLAAWWNPTSWFSAKSTYEIKDSADTQSDLPLVNNTDANISATTSITNQNVTERIVEKIVEKPTIVERVVTKTVQDPALQTKITLLLSENAALKQQLDTQKNEYSQCTLELDKKVATVNEQATANNEKAKLSQNIRIKIAEMNQLTVQIDTYLGPALFDVLTNARKLSGEWLFAEIIAIKGANIKSIAPEPGRTNPSLKQELKSIVNNYKAFLLVELEKNQ